MLYAVFDSFLALENPTRRAIFSENRNFSVILTLEFYFLTTYEISLYEISRFQWNLPDKSEILNSLDDGSSCAFTSMKATVYGGSMFTLHADFI